MEKVKTKKNPRVFYLTEKLIGELISHPKRWSVDHIAALLALAAYTDKSGIYSTAGTRAVRNALAIGDKRVQGLLEDLRGFDVIKDATRCRSKAILEEMPQREGKAKVRWIIPSDDSRRIWFSSHLVLGIGQWKKPLYTLRTCGQGAARILLALYCHEDLMSWGGVDPSTTICYKYNSELMDDAVGLHHCSKASLSAKTSFPRTLGYYDVEGGGTPDAFWDGIERLEQSGFIYQSLTIFTGEDIEPDICLLYPLHTFNRHGHAPKGEESIAGKMHAVAQACGYPTAGSDGRFYGTFPYLADAGNAQAVGIFRLRFRNTSPAFSETLEGWLHIKQCRQEGIDQAERCLA